jgi:ATP-dependent RNA helicase DeaD
MRDPDHSPTSSPDPVEAPAGPSFGDLGLPEALVAGLAARGITLPTPVQAGVIPFALTGGDLLAQARTGSGKTLAFLLPLAARLAAGEIHRAWIVCPTRELAQQAAREAALVLGEGRAAVLVGGLPPGPQVRDLRRDPALVIGTPGRMCDHLAQGALQPDAEIVILDEADQMLDLGFADELERLVKDLGESVARWLFSATFPPQVQAAILRWLDAPREVRLDVRAASAHVPQKYVLAPRGEETAALARLLHSLQPERALVFVRTRDRVDDTVRAIAGEGLEAAGISGDLPQEARERVLDRFRAGKLTVLVGTDVAARGIDVPGVSHVFNLGLPASAEAYTHRIGRTARAGAYGEAWTVIGLMERGRFLRQMVVARCSPAEVPLPTAATIVDAKRVRLASRVQDSLGAKLALPAAFQPLVDEFGAEAVLAGLVHRLIPDALPEKPAWRPSPADRGPRAPYGAPREAGRLLPEEGMAALYVGLGLIDGVQPGTVIALLCHQCGIAGTDIGKIRLFDRHTLVGVRETVVANVLERPLHLRGRAVPVRRDASAPPRPPVGGEAPLRRPKRVV